LLIAGVSAAIPQTENAENTVTAARTNAIIFFIL
jgi:hypothetical protein